MNLIDMHYKGAMADDPALPVARATLDRIKAAKIAVKADKWRGSDRDMRVLLKDLASELTELCLAVDAGRVADTLAECADLSNMVDIIASLALKVERGMFSGSESKV